MATILLRSPRYETLTAPSGAVSAKLELTIDSTLRYTIIKDCTAGSPVLFEIAELCRDYLTPAVKLSPPDYPLNSITISRAIKFYPQANAGGTQVGTTDTATHIGLDGYGTFNEGSNPTVGTRTMLFTPKYAASGNTFEIFVPTNTAGAFQYTDSSGAIQNNDFTAGDTSDTVETTTVIITRIDCTKYGAGRKIIFINRYGALQELWFFLKEVNTTNVKSDKYQRNIISTTGTYSNLNHPIKTFDKQGKVSHSLSSGFYPESANAWFEELLLSEYVWMVRPRFASPSSNEIVPLTVKTSNITHKTSLNDKLIQYTIQFEEAFDYINNVR